MKYRIIGILVVIALAVIFLLQNTQEVTLRLYFWKFSLSQVILIPLVLVVGFLLGYIVARTRGRKKVKRPPVKAKK